MGLEEKGKLTDGEMKDDDVERDIRWLVRACGAR